MKTLKRIFCIALALVTVASFAACGAQESKQASETTTQAVTEAATTTAATTEETTTEEETTTVAIPTEPITFVLFGCDTQAVTPVDDRRSDMIKIVQIDPVERTIKFIGILRDTKVPIEGHDPQKINGAFMYGGADLALKTINENFGLDLGKYIMINFSETIRLVDDIGGVEVEISDEEAAAINYHASDFTSDNRMESTVPLTQGGTVTLNGVQTLAFCRSRKIDSDYFRSARQNKVLKAIIKKLQSMPQEQYPDIINAFFISTETNMSFEDINVWTLLDIGNYEFSGYMVPDENYESDVNGGLDDTGSWVWTYNTQAAGNRIKAILNGSFVPLASQNEYGEAADVHDGIGKGSQEIEQ